VREKGLEEVSVDDQTVKVNNTGTNTPNESSNMTKMGRAGPLTFDPCPERTQDDQHVHIPSVKQAELVHWHYRLGHLSFPKLKALAKIGKISKHLANMLPPVCAGCAF